MSLIPESCGAQTERSIRSGYYPDQDPICDRLREVDDASKCDVTDHEFKVERV